MASKLAVEQAFTSLQAILDEASRAETDYDLAHRAEAWQTLHDMRNGLAGLGVEIADADWNKTSMSGKRQLLQEAAKNMHAQTRAFDPDEEAYRAYQAEQRIPDAEFYRDTPLDPARRNPTPEQADAERDRVRRGVARGDWQPAYRNGHPVKQGRPADHRDEREADDYTRAFRAWMRGGESRMNSRDRDALYEGWHEFNGREARALGGYGGGAAGGYLVPALLRSMIVDRIKSYAGIWDAGRVLNLGTETGASLGIPTNDDVANVGVIVSENADVGTITDPAFGQVSLGAYTYSSKPLRVSFQMLQDTAIGDLEGYLSRLLARRIGRAIAPHLATGTGTGQPEGIVTNAPIGVTGATGSATTFTYDHLVDLIAALDVGYLGNAAWLMSPQAKAVAMKIKDGQQRPIFVDAVSGMPAEMLGYPVVLDPAIPAPAANAKSVLFGDFAEGYAVRHVTGEGMIMLRLSERYAEFGQVGFLLFYRLDAKPVMPAAYTSFKHSAT